MAPLALSRRARLNYSMDTTSIHIQNVATNRPFRYMDLPTELRLHIAEYVLLADKPLSWIWITYGENAQARSGTFEGLESLTAFTRTSRQIYSETAGVVWKLNKVHFNHYHLSLIAYRNRYDFQDVNGDLISEAYSFFSHHVPRSTRMLMKSFQFAIACKDYSQDHLTQVRDMITRFADDISNKSFDLVDGLWYVDIDLGLTYGYAEELGSFLSRGRQIGRALANIKQGQAGNLRVMPCLDEEERCVIEKFLKGEELQLAREWDRNGIRAVVR